MKRQKVPACQQTGQTLFELVIALGVGVLVVTSIVAVVTVSLRNANFAKNKTEATKYAQEALEWLRSEKERDWAGFYARSASPAYWCLQSLAWPQTSVQCVLNQTVTGAATFTREVTLRREDIDLDGSRDDVAVTATVSWTEGGRMHSSQASTQFGDINK